MRLWPVNRYFGTKVPVRFRQVSALEHVSFRQVLLFFNFRGLLNHSRSLKWVIWSTFDTSPLSWFRRSVIRASKGKTFVISSLSRVLYIECFHICSLVLLSQGEDIFLRELVLSGVCIIYICITERPLYLISTANFTINSDWRNQPD